MAVKYNQMHLKVFRAFSLEKKSQKMTSNYLKGKYKKAVLLFDSSRQASLGGEYIGPDSMSQEILSLIKKAWVSLCFSSMVWVYTEGMLSKVRGCLLRLRPLSPSQMFGFHGGRDGSIPNDFLEALMCWEKCTSDGWVANDFLLQRWKVICVSI